VLALAAASTSSAASATQASPRYPFCSWWFETNPQNPTTNVALPDTSATYWTTPFFAAPGLKITVKGQFTNARFMSVTVYDNSGGTFTRNGVSSGLVDYLIKPDPGTRNPFQEPTAGHGRFTLTIQRHVSTAQSNVLPMVPATPSTGGLLPPGFGFIIFRVYLPHDGFDAVKLPTLVFFRRGSTQTLPTCSGNPGPVVKKLEQRLVARIKANASGAVKFPPPSGQPAFAKPTAGTINSLFPNIANAYLAAPFNPTPGTVVVVQGRAPTFTPDSSAQPWPNPAFDIRYWSLCNNEDATPYPVVVATDPQTQDQILGCSPDLNTPIVNGQYTYVLSSISERPANATAANGVAWLPYGDQVNNGVLVPEVLLFRNMLGDAFANSVQAVPAGSTAAAAQTVMGAYYPRMAQCSVATFTAGGASACFAVAGGQS
jgi:hypothetical protein